MKCSRFGEDQIIGILKRHEAGQKVADLERDLVDGMATRFLANSLPAGIQNGIPRFSRSGSRGIILPETCLPFL